jgi:hypothetical protein
MPDSLGSESARNFRPDLAREFEYLLGQMPRVDRETFQGQLIENAETSDRVVEAEQELFDAYARNRLPGEWRVAFEERLLGAPEGRAKLALARGIARQAKPARSRLWWIFGGLAATVAIVLVFFTTCNVTRPCEAPQTPPSATAAPKTQTFELAAITRGQAERPRLSVDAPASQVQLTVKEPADAFELSLVIAQRTIAKAPAGTSLRVDTNLLEPGIYLLTAFRNGTASNYYEFEVVRP